MKPYTQVVALDESTNLAGNSCSKLTIKTVEQGVKYANKVLMSLLFYLNIFHTLF